MVVSFVVLHFICGSSGCVFVIALVVVCVVGVCCLSSGFPRPVRVLDYGRLGRLRRGEHCQSQGS